MAVYENFMISRVQIDRSRCLPSEREFFSCRVSSFCSKVSVKK